jgi:hypothetical protein
MFNMGATYERLFEAPRIPVADKGSDTLKLQSKNSEKMSLASVDGISDAGEKWPL